MQLISLEFFLFFAATLLLYNILPKGQRWIVLLISSLVFYISAGAFAILYILAVSLSSFLLALFLQKGKEGGNFALSLALYVGVLLLVGGWVTLKMLSDRGEIMLPLGISFYSLRVISYLLDVKRKRVRVERNYPRYLLFVCYVPVVLQGPIVLYKDISSSLYSGRRADGEERMSGLI